MARDVVAMGEELAVHERSGARGDGITGRVRADETGDERWDVERSLEVVELPHDGARGIALGWRLLRDAQLRAEPNE
jgi:hypothetical protein